MDEGKSRISKKETRAVGVMHPWYVEKIEKGKRFQSIVRMPKIAYRNRMQS